MRTLTALCGGWWFGLSASSGFPDQLRDVIGHHYDRIVPEITHRTVESDLGPLKQVAKRMRDTQEESVGSQPDLLSSGWGMVRGDQRSGQVLMVARGAIEAPAL
jgi:hypothetical protein